MRKTFVLATVTLAAIAAGASARAGAPPVERVPNGRLATLVTTRGESVAIVLPHRRTGLVWRLESHVDAHVLRRRAEVHAGYHTVVLYEAVGSGVVKLVYGLNRGDCRQAIQGRRFLVFVL